MASFCRQRRPARKQRLAVNRWVAPPQSVLAVWTSVDPCDGAGGGKTGVLSEPSVSGVGVPPLGLWCAASSAAPSAAPYTGPRFRRRRDRVR